MTRMLLICAVACLPVPDIRAQEFPVGVLVYDPVPPVEGAIEAVDPVGLPDAVIATPLAVEAPVLPISGTVYAPASTRSIREPLGIEPLPLVDLSTGTVLANPGSAVETAMPGSGPQPVPVYTARYGAPKSARPAPKIDPLTGRLRDTAGWTGRTDGPASIGCFPQGACAVLNMR